MRGMLIVIRGAPSSTMASLARVTTWAGRSRRGRVYQPAGPQSKWSASTIETREAARAG